MLTDAPNRSNFLFDLYTNIAFMTEQSKPGYQIILGARNFEETIREFYLEQRGVVITDQTHTIISET
ncbi:hypothetical protein HYALB_00013524 [Hymenoscyphus albidus]|uniref:Uncharacterized protein n=1 Tax=Hymenoscyphus albidus TaxID=595503 RepID=A0A9N9LUW9_9HELO|nr:hypothetical protein HYALB_00013524 [Hymenoscyphus albidus]